MKPLYTVVAVVGIAVAGTAAWWYQNKPVTATVMSGAASGAGGPGAPASGARPGGGGPGGPAPVEVGKVEKVSIEDDAQAVGSVRSNQGVMLRPEVSGRISKVNFRDGQRIKRGQLLVQLDDTLQQAQLQQAKAQASIARTNLQRNRELVAQNFVSASAVDQSAAALEVAEAQVALAQAQAARMRIIAPFDGVAGIASVNLGDYVKDGADLVNIEDLSSVWIDFRLAERYLARLKAGQPVEVQLDAMPGRKFSGKVDAVDSQLDANGRSLLVRARLTNGDGTLRSGMFARARIVFERRERAFVVPEEALVPLGGKQYIVKVVDTPNGKMAQRIEARIGVRLPGKAEILEGVSEGDVVVTAGQARVLRPEPSPVRIVDISRPPGGPSRAASGAQGASSPGNGNRPASSAPATSV